MKTTDPGFSFWANFS